MVFQKSTEEQKNIQNYPGGRVKIENLVLIALIDTHTITSALSSSAITNSVKWCIFIISISDFIWDFRKLPLPSNLGNYFIKIGKIGAKIHEIGKINAIFGLEMTPV